MSPFRALLHLRRDYKYGGAPHKPILLLAVMGLVERGVLRDNKIPVSGELLLEFRALWSQLVNTASQCNFALPFFHLKSSSFWELITYEGKTIPVTSSNSIRSLSALRESVAYALLDEAYFRAFADPVQREQLRQEMLAVYFPNTKQFYKAGLNAAFLADYGQLQLEEPALVYTAKSKALFNSLDKQERE